MSRPTILARFHAALAALALVFLWARPAQALRCVEEKRIRGSDRIVWVEITDSSELARPDSSGRVLIRWGYRVVEVLKGSPGTRGTVLTVDRVISDGVEEVQPLYWSLEMGKQYVLFLHGAEPILQGCAYPERIVPGGRLSEPYLAELREQIRAAK